MSFEMTRAIFESGITGLERLVALELANFHNGKTGQMNPSIQTLVERTGICDKTIRTILHSLRDKGQLEIIPSNGRGSRYVFKVTPVSDTAVNGTAVVNTEVTDTGHPGKAYRTPRYEIPDTPVSDTGKPVRNPECNQEENQEPELFSLEAPSEKPAKSFIPDENQKRINRLYSRRDTTPWSKAEIKQWRSLHMEEDDIQIIESARASGWQYYRKNIQTLLNNWRGEVEGAQDFLKKGSPSSNGKVDYAKMPVHNQWIDHDLEYEREKTLRSQQS